MSARAAGVVVIFWVLIGAAYLASFQIDAYRFETGFEVTPGTAVLFVVVYTSWAPLTFALFALLRAPIAGRRWGQVALLWLLGFVVWQPAILLLDKTIAAYVLGKPIESVVAAAIGTRTTVHFFHAVLYVIVFATCAVLTYQQDLERNQLAALSLSKRNAEAERDLTSAQLRALQARLSPHFLFNCLNSISGLARGGESDRVVSTVAQLGDLLRYALEASERSLVSVREEMDFVIRYVALQKLRFGDRFALELDVDPSTHSHECPPFVLQALIENVFAHEVSYSSAPVSMTVEVRRWEGRLRFVVSNSRSGAEPRAPSLGTAMADLERRLDILYAGRGELQRESTPDRYIVRVSLPDEGPEA